MTYFDEMRLKMKNRSHKNDKNKSRPRHGNKYNKHKTCSSMMILLCIKQQRVAYKKEACSERYSRTARNQANHASWNNHGINGKNKVDSIEHTALKMQV